MLKTPNTYLVGGAVRDELLGLNVKDRDWVVVGASIQTMLDEGFSQVGKDFPVFLHPKSKEEYALARTERKMGRGYTGFQCDASPSVTLEQDLLRRDLTINAMAKSKDGHIIDPFNGQQDLHNRVLRHVSPAFIEDPLRVLRVARFAARYAYLGFSVAPHTRALMDTIAQANELHHLAAERVWQETEKALAESTPDVYFEELALANATRPWFEELFPSVRNSHTKKAMRHIAEHHKINTAYMQCGLLSIIVPEQGVLAWLERLKAPKINTTFSATTTRMLPYLTNEPMSAHRLVALLNSADVWRRESIFNDALDVFDAFYCEQPAKWQKTKTLILQALQIAKNVSVQDIIATGVKGSAIKEALNDKRTQRIGAELKL